jgi:hypothetical protein
MNWWPALIGFAFFSVAYYATYPVAVLPFRLTCHKDLWGEPPATSCTDYWCPKIEPERLHDWPQCKGYKGN